MPPTLAAHRSCLARLRGRRGALSVEWVGILVVVGVLVLAVVAAAPGFASSLAGRTQRAVCDVVGRSCSPLAAPAGDATPTELIAASAVAGAAAGDGGALKVQLDAAGGPRSYAELAAEVAALEQAVADLDLPAIGARLDVLEAEAKRVARPVIGEPEGDPRRRLDATGRPVEANRAAILRLIAIDQEARELGRRISVVGQRAIDLDAAIDYATYPAGGPDTDPYDYAKLTGGYCDPSAFPAAGQDARLIALDNRVCSAINDVVGYSNEVSLPGRPLGMAVVRDGFLEGKWLDETAKDVKEEGKDLGRDAAEAETPEEAKRLLEAAVEVQHRLEAFKNAMALRQERIAELRAAGNARIPTDDAEDTVDRIYTPDEFFDAWGTPFGPKEYDDMREDIPGLADRQTGYTAEVAQEVRVAKREAQAKWPALDWAWVPGNLGEPGDLSG